MSEQPAIAIFDAGKTNKKVFVFDENYRILEEHTCRLDETTDEDGFPCEDVHALRSWVRDMLHQVVNSSAFHLKAINFTAYGASFVHLDAQGHPYLPLYNYLKPYPGDLLRQFFDTYGGEETITRETASPVLGHLNSGLLLYRLLHEKKYAAKRGVSLHLPQYLSYLVTQKLYSDITSIGCHTMLWNFEERSYHRWVHLEGVHEILAPLFPSDDVMQIHVHNKPLLAGAGLHDSSSALIPYLAVFHEPFVLISTGTWAITLNAFNHSPLTPDELKQDCLCYLTYKGQPVKASRLFAGHMHEEGVKKLAAYFQKDERYFQEVRYDEGTAQRYMNDAQTNFEGGDWNVMEDFDSAYHYLVADIVQKQVHSSNLVMSDNITRIFVDGGFGNNELYMRMLAQSFPHREVYAASVPQATAMGAAVAIHRFWNNRELENNLVELRRVVQ